MQSSARNRIYKERDLRAAAKHACVYTEVPTCRARPSSDVGVGQYLAISVQAGAGEEPFEPISTQAPHALDHGGSHSGRWPGRPHCDRPS
jgi:hypothetical protein